MRLPHRNNTSSPRERHTKNGDVVLATRTHVLHVWRLDECVDPGEVRELSTAERGNIATAIPYIPRVGHSPTGYLSRAHSYSPALQTKPSITLHFTAR